MISHDMTSSSMSLSFPGLAVLQIYLYHVNILFLSLTHCTASAATVVIVELKVIIDYSQSLSAVTNVI